LLSFVLGACSAAAPPPQPRPASVEVPCDPALLQMVELQIEAAEACGEIAPKRTRCASDGPHQSCSKNDFAILQRDAACKRDACRAHKGVGEACGRPLDGINWGCVGGRI
ncbi:MAG TPA: hypothetical protein VF316_02660, partial [Polyangiaceae bacterium]